jgi:hypothetical protein
MNTIDLRTIPSNIPSLCIPRAFPNINEKRIRQIFMDLDMGEIERIDFVSRKTDDGKMFNRVFIHFKSWKTNGDSVIARERLLNGQDIKIVYDDPWFWKVSAYRSNNRVNKKTYKQKSTPRLEFDKQEVKYHSLSNKKENTQHTTQLTISKETTQKP